MSESQPLACDESASPMPEIDKETQKKAQDVMKDHLDIMRDVVMKIRHQEGYAKAMYANCPRLQHLLDRNPDLRPVFEDPRLVRINFETVYKEAGGILPEDEEEEERKKNNPSLILRIANHPIFKIFKILLFVKKIIACVAGGGIALVTSFYACCTECCTDCCCEDAVEEIGEVDADDEYGIDIDAPLDENQKALNTAADYMEDPEVQEQMQRLLEDPENLEDAIENDAELRALRDSNPLCAELMQDPETMKILTDPDNLRALGEAPQMIELDFSDPHGFSPEADFVDVEAGEFEGYDGSGEDFLEASASMDGLEAYEADYDENEVYFPMEDDPNDLIELGYEDDGAAMGEEAFEDEMVEEVGAKEIEMSEVGGIEGEEPLPAQQTTTSGWEDNFDMEQQELDVEMDADGDADAEAANKGKGKGKETKQRKADAPKRGGMAGVVSSMGVAATDLIAASIVGEIFGSDFLPGDLMGGGDMGPDLEGIDAVANQADAVVDDQFADLAEETADDIKDEKDAYDEKSEEKKRQSRYFVDDSGRKSYIGLMETTAAAAAATTAIGPMLGSDQESSIDDGLESIGSKESDFRDEDDSEKASDIDDSPEKPKSKVGGFFKSLASTTVTAAKEQLASALIGDDFAEMLVEKQEEKGEPDDENKKKKKRFGLFGRKKGDEEEEASNVDKELRESFQITDSGKNDQNFYDTLPAYEFEANEDEGQYNPDFNASIADYYSSEFNMHNSTVSIPPVQVFEANEEDEEHDPNFYNSNPEYSTSIPERNFISTRRKSALSSSMPPDLVFEANEDEEEYDPNFYGSDNPDYTSPTFTFPANEDEEEYDPNFYRTNPEYVASYRDDEDDTLEGSSSRRGYFG